jgi:hypothetical protein
MRYKTLCFILVVFVLSACSRSAQQIQPESSGVSTIVAATLVAMTPSPTAAPEPTSTPVPPATPSTGKVSGKVCYHDKGIIRLNIYFQSSLAAEKPVVIPVASPEETYSVELAAGTYTVYSWPPDYTIGALPVSGMTIDVAPGADLTGIDLCDFSKGPFSVPYPPGFSPSTEYGSISGQVTGYPGASGAQFTVAAFNQGTGYWYYVLLMPGETKFSIPDLPAGRYQVVAYDGQGAAGGVSDVYVIAGQNSETGISEWGGEYPENPVK